jgi:hypothetical protein
VTASVFGPSKLLKTPLPPHSCRRPAGLARLGFVDYKELHARPPQSDIEALQAYAREQGLWRFEEAPRYERVAELAREGELAA